LITRDIKPYDGGNEAIWPIHRLDIADKHRLLIPVVDYASIVGLEIEDEQGKPIYGFVPGTWQESPWYIHIPNGLHVKNKGKPTRDIEAKLGDQEAVQQQKKNTTAWVDRA